ncbi:hypothetical protein ACFCYH_20830 [Streptomyces sp. NPDC056400]|uniref:hypothetical protein n=1 Tax=Streptomyces sp. NPDC056400 TaxID=3345808 RepID=UPI0035E36DCF
MIMLQLAANQGLSDFQQKIIVGLIGAIIGASATLLAHFLKARAEPRKRISWDSSIDPGFAAVDPEIKEKLDVTYDHVRVKNIYSIKYRVSNTGNRVVKNQRVRFKFKDDTQVLESYISPTPEPELKVELEPSSSAQEVIYNIGHLERTQSVQFRFVTAGESAKQWEAFPSNEEGDVEVEKKGVAEKREDRTHIRPFIISLFLFLVVPYSFSSSLIDEPIAEALTVITRATFLVYMLLHIAPVARTIQDVLSNPENPRGGNTYHTVAHDGGTALVLSDGDVNGNVEFHRPNGQ